MLATCDTSQAQYIDADQFVMHQPVPDTAVSVREIYGVNPGEFWIGSYWGVRSDDYNWSHLWSFLNTMNIKIVEWRESPVYHAMDSLIDAANGRSGGGVWDQRVIACYGLNNLAGFARQVVFFPWDTVQSYYWQCRFKTIDSGMGVKSYNPSSAMSDIYGHQATEMVYSSSNTTANDTVAKRIVFGYDPTVHLYRYFVKGSAYLDSAENSSAMYDRNDLDYGNHRNLYMVLNAHLFDPVSGGGGGASNSDPVLAIDIYTEVPKGTKYKSSSAPATADNTNDREFLYKTILVTKSDLAPVDIVPDYNKYRVLSYKVDLFQDPVSGSYGPFCDENSAHRMDMRVRWVGTEKVALRSIALEDEMSHLLFARNGDGATERQTIVDEVDRVMKGPSGTDNTRTGKVTRFYTGDESGNTRVAGYNYLDSLIYRRYPEQYGSAAHDSAVRGTRAWRAFSGDDPYMSSANEIGVETYPSYGYKFAYSVSDRYPLPAYVWNVPTIRQHNGGRFGILELALDPNNPSAARDSIELYSKAEQYWSLGFYTRDSLKDVEYAWMVNKLGHAAWAGRRTGRRLIQWPGVHISGALHWVTDEANPSYARLDTGIVHLPDAAEIRTNVSLGLCYGVSGVHYSFAGFAPTNFAPASASLHLPSAPTAQLYNWDNDFGFMGVHLSDSMDRALPLILTPPGPAAITIPDFYIGFGVRMREIRNIDSWLTRIGPEIMKLRWREGYSIHTTVAQPTFSGPPQYPARLLPSNDIVTAVTAQDRFGKQDPAQFTFVELGFFDRHHGADSSDHMLDTNYVFVVNRRTFERPTDVDSTTALGHLMDSLAETRTINLKLNLTHPDGGHYNFVRVTEIQPDVTPLPWTGVARHTLDTILNGDSVVALTLRPGGGSLLRITYAPSTNEFTGGDIRFSSQRKIVFDGRRYHACYYKRVNFLRPLQGPIGVKKQTSSNDEEVFYRRSEPMYDTIGGIRWEPTEYLLSDTTFVDSLSIQQRFPSITVRLRTNSSKTDTVATVVWSGYGGPTARNVYLRNIVSSGTTVGVAQGPETVARVAGSIDTLWAMPVVSRLFGGDMIAWADSALGIRSRLRRLGGGANWWQPSATGVLYTPITNVALAGTQPAGFSTAPTMPAFAHVVNDSNIGIAWQRMIVGASRTEIQYGRLLHKVIAGTDQVGVFNQRVISQGEDKMNVHPSLDATQDVWHELHEGITWESIENISFFGFHAMRTWVHFSSLNTIMPGATSQWTDNKLLVEGPMTASGLVSEYVYPNTSSLNERDTALAHQDALIHFGLVMSKTGSHGMRQAIQHYAIHEAATVYNYSVGGWHPNGAASPVRQPLREVALYETTTASFPPLTTSRQFFAKTRPTGYTAVGRQTNLRINDSLRTGVSLRLHDVWFADDDAAGGVAMISYPDSVRFVDSLPQVRSLMRTGYFHAHDSTTIGCQLFEALYGDSATYAPYPVDVIAELVDSASGSVKGQLDSFRLTSVAIFNDTTVSKTYDLISGTYYVRMRIQPVNTLPTVTVTGVSRFPTVEVGSMVDGPILPRLRRIDRVTGELGRMSLQPNPVSDHAEIFFSIPDREDVSMTIYDGGGRRVAQPIETTMTEAGRYVLDIDCRALLPGAYLVECRYGGNRMVEKLVIVR
ncbi:MAG: Filamentous hemagglutinin family outer membrane protein [Chlorobi bacterium]|nr:Filamentous hemagglutinin family outer membrane protein [Chlorobiota bacterium]